MSVWRKRFDKGDIALRKTDNKKLTDKTDFEAWDILFIDFVNKVGLDSSFEDYLKKLVERIGMVAQYIQTKKTIEGVQISDRFILNRIKYLESQIAAFEKTGSTEKITIPQMLGKLGKMQGYKVSENETTVLEYFELIKEYKQWVKAK